MLAIYGFHLENDYCTGAIITHGSYTFYPLFEDQKHFFKEDFSENSAFMYG